MRVFSVLTFLIAGFFAVSVLGAPDNRGKEFIIAFMENYNLKENFPLELFITTSSTQSVLVNVTSPKWQTPFINETFTVTAGNVQQLKLDQRIRLEGSELSSKAILVQASHEIVLYGVNIQKFSNDAFLGLPTDVLGTKYFTLTYYPPFRKTQILAVAIEDDTLLDIYLTANTNLNEKLLLKGEKFSQQMNKYDAMQLQSDEDFTGTMIKSNKPVNVFSGNKKTNIGSGTTQDHLVESLSPVETWGKSFATVPIPERTTGDFFKIIASTKTEILFQCIKDNTYNNFTVTLQKAGEFHQRKIDSDTYCSIKSTEAILVMQLVLSQISNDEPSDPSMILIPPIEQYAADYTFTTPKYSKGTYDNFFLFVVKKTERTGLRIDDKRFPNDIPYQEIPGTKFVGGYIPISNGFHKVAHVSPISVFCGFLYGRAKTETYGFPVGMRMAKINAMCTPTTTVEADGIDNDCDGLIDEELCAPGQGIPDDDEDGKINEDCAKPYKADGEWSHWSNWSDCTATCEDGTQERSRTCTNPPPQSGGQNCSGPQYESQQCNTHKCPIHGNWTEWEAWTNCSKPCDGGIQVQRRFCTNPKPKYGGSVCTGNPINTKPCNIHRCDADGEWSRWSNWSDCTATCEAGTKERSRTCTSPPPQSGGQNCSGPQYESQHCNTHKCPIHGNWTEWEAWTNCSKPCDGGTQVQRRFCTNPMPKYGGSVCTGNSINTKTCNVHRCDGLCNCARFRRLSDHVKCGGPRNITWKQEQEEIKQYLSQIRRNLLVNKKKTSRYIRTITSSSDDRLSASAIGYFFVSLLTSIGVGFIIIDTRIFHTHFKRATSNIKSFF